MANEKHHLPIRLKLKPGESGTKKMVDKYGDALVCVRYRYDEGRGLRYKTVELIEETITWEGMTPKRGETSKPTPSDRFGVRIGYAETELRDKVKQMGGIWRPQQKLWEMSYAQIEALGLRERIVENG